MILSGSVHLISGLLDPFLMGHFTSSCHFMGGCSFPPPSTADVTLPPDAPTTTDPVEVPLPHHRRSTASGFSKHPCSASVEEPLELHGVLSDPTTESAPKPSQEQSPSEKCSRNGYDGGVCRISVA